MSTWYMTVGVPGGEYAAQVDVAKEHCWEDVRDYFAEAMDSVRFRDAEPSEQMDGSAFYDFYIRPCPPELVEWIEAEMHDYHETNAGIGRMKITGGWLYEVHDAQDLNSPDDEHPNYNVVVHAMERVPVVGAAGLTILEEK